MYSPVKGRLGPTRTIVRRQLRFTRTNSESKYVLYIIILYSYIVMLQLYMHASLVKYYRLPEDASTPP